MSETKSHHNSCRPCVPWPVPISCLLSFGGASDLLPVRSSTGVPLTSDTNPGAEAGSSDFSTTAEAVKPSLAAAAKRPSLSSPFPLFVGFTRPFRYRRMRKKAASAMPRPPTPIPTPKPMAVGFRSLDELLELPLPLVEVPVSDAPVELAVLSGVSEVIVELEVVVVLLSVVSAVVVGLAVLETLSSDRVLVVEGEGEGDGVDVAEA